MGRKEKKNLNIKKVIRVALIILAIVFLCVLSFIGIYREKDGKSVNIIRDYKFANDFDKYYEIQIEPNRSARDEYVFVDKDGNLVREVPSYEKKDNKLEAKVEKEPNLDEIKALSGDDKVNEYKIEKRAVRYNEADKLNENEFRATRNKIVAILADQRITSYNIREDLKTGKFIFEVPQNAAKDINIIRRALTQNGKFEVTDSLTDRPYLTNKDLKNFKLIEDQRFGLVIQLELNNEGKEKFKQVTTKYSDMYKKVKEENEKLKKEKGKDFKEKKAPELVVKISGEVMQKGPVGAPIENGLIQMAVGKVDRNSENYQKYISEIEGMKSSLKVAEKPLEYDILSEKLIEGRVDVKKAQVLLIVVVGVFIILAASLIIFFGLKGVLSALALAGYLAVMLIILRYSNIDVTIASIVGIILVYILEYIFLVLLNVELQDNGKDNVDFAKVYIKQYKEMISVIIIAIILTFSVHIELASFGMIVSLGIITKLIYNSLITKNLIRD